MVVVQVSRMMRHDAHRLHLLDRGLDILHEFMVSYGIELDVGKRAKDRLAESQHALCLRDVLVQRQAVRPPLPRGGIRRQNADVTDLPKSDKAAPVAPNPSTSSSG